MLRHMSASPGETTPWAERQTDRMPPPVGTRVLGTRGAQRFVLRGGAAGTWSRWRGGAGRARTGAGTVRGGSGRTAGRRGRSAVAGAAGEGPIHASSSLPCGCTGGEGEAGGAGVSGTDCPAG